MKYLFYSIVCSIPFLAQISCSPIKNKATPQTISIAELSSMAIFQHLNSETTDFFNQFSKGLPKINPWLCARDTIRQKDTLYFFGSLDFDLITKPIAKDSFRLTIPDSLKLKYRYIGETSNNMRDFATIYEFSPLLPTADPKIFLIQEFIWHNDCGDLKALQDTICTRFGSRRFLKFKIENNKIDFVEPVGIPNDNNDVLFFPWFHRRKLNN